MRRSRHALAAALVAALTAPPAAAQTVELVPERTALEWPTVGGQVADGGDRVVFETPAGDLVPRDTNGVNDLFLHRRSTGRTVRVSVGPRGRQADGGSFGADLSADGRWLAFCSSARNLLRRRVAVPDPADPAIYLRDLRRGRTRMVSRHAARDLEGEPVCRPSVTGGGRRVAFATGDGSVRRIRLFDRRTGRSRTIARGPALDGDRPSVSADGRAVVFGSLAPLTRDDTDVSPDVFRYGVRSRRLALVSTAPGIVTCAPEASVSRRGRHAAFACDFVVYVADRRRGVTRAVAPSGERPLISGDGARIAFQSVDPLLPGGSTSWTEVYTLARDGSAPARVARTADGRHPGGHVLLTDLSADGRWIAFGSTSTLLGFPRVSPSGDVFVSGPWR